MKNNVSIPSHVAGALQIFKRSPETFANAAAVLHEEFDRSSIDALNVPARRFVESFYAAVAAVPVAILARVQGEGSLTFVFDDPAAPRLGVAVFSRLVTTSDDDKVIIVPLHLIFAPASLVKAVFVRQILEEYLRMLVPQFTTAMVIGVHPMLLATELLAHRLGVSAAPPELLLWHHAVVQTGASDCLEFMRAFERLPVGQAVVEVFTSGTQRYLKCGYELETLLKNPGHLLADLARIAP